VSVYVTDPDLLISRVVPYDHLTYLDDDLRLSTDAGTGVVTWDAPTLDDVGELCFRIEVYDSENRYDEQMVNLTVNNTSGQHVICYIPH